LSILWGNDDVAALGADRDTRSLNGNAGDLLTEGQLVQRNQEGEPLAEQDFAGLVE